MKVKNRPMDREKRQHELEKFICGEFIKHDIMFLSELLCNISIDIECPACTSLFEHLMGIRRDLKKELSQMRNAECGMRRKRFNRKL